jgi:hypothetical protein
MSGLRGEAGRIGSSLMGRSENVSQSNDRYTHSALT